MDGTERSMVVERSRAGRGWGADVVHTLVLLIACAAVPTFTSPAADARPTPQFQFQSKPRSATDLVKVTLTSDASRIGPGETFHLIVEFTIEPKWHIYWKNPGETGAPTEFDITGPNYDIGQPIFARPQRIEAPDGVTFGYEKRAVVVIPVTAPKNLGDGAAQFQVSSSFLVCKDVCMMGRPRMSIDIATSATPTGHENSSKALGQQLDASLPQTLKDLERARVNFDSGTLTIIAPAGEDESVAFFPIELPGVTYDKARIVHRDAMTHIIVAVEVKPENALGEPMRVAGLIAFGKEETDPCYEFELPVLVADEPADSSGN
jgi:DsbC/DsbD-like thiol-disulfide interchange protein